MASCFRLQSLAGHFTNFYFLLQLYSVTSSYLSKYAINILQIIFIAKDSLTTSQLIIHWFPVFVMISKTVECTATENIMVTISFQTVNTITDHHIMSFITNDSLHFISTLTYLQCLWQVLDGWPRTPAKTGHIYVAHLAQCHWICISK